MQHLGSSTRLHLLKAKAAVHAWTHLVDVRAQMVVPALAALLAGPARQLRGNLRPLQHSQHNAKTDVRTVDRVPCWVMLVPKGDSRDSDNSDVWAAKARRAANGRNESVIILAQTTWRFAKHRHTHN